MRGFLRRKTAAYTAMFEALHDMGAWFDKNWDAENEKREIPEEESNRLGIEYRKARDVLLRRIASEAWLLPPECIKRVKEMNRTLSKRHQSFFDDIESGYIAVGSATFDLERMVRRDLRLGDPRMREFTLKKIIRRLKTKA
jgi:hypothetical protein